MKYRTGLAVTSQTKLPSTHPNCYLRIIITSLVQTHNCMQITFMDSSHTRSNKLSTKNKIEHSSSHIFTSVENLHHLVAIYELRTL